MGGGGGGDNGLANKQYELQKQQMAEESKRLKELEDKKTNEALMKSLDEQNTLNRKRKGRSSTILTEEGYGGGGGKKTLG